MRTFVLCAALFLASCVPNQAPNQAPISDTQRLLQACESWTVVFRKIDSRDQFGLASDKEVEAIDKAIPILGPACKGAPEDALAAGLSLDQVESLLLKAVLANQEQSS